MRMQTLVALVFPPECLSCRARVDSPFALCGACWSDTPFILGASCELCGTGLEGQTASQGPLVCETCHHVARPWDKGRAVMAYAGNGRKLVLALKHGDRTEVARAAGPWLARAAADLVADNPLVVPIPLHPFRLMRRRYNQAALLAQALGRAARLDVEVQALCRVRMTPSQSGHDQEARFVNLADAIRPHPRNGQTLRGRPVLIVDDVMTSGATFAAATEACRMAGAAKIRVLSLARAARDA